MVKSLRPAELKESGADNNTFASNEKADLSHLFLKLQTFCPC